MQPAETDNPLFAASPVVEAPTPPVVVVGLPRSGSSFLSHVLSTLDGWYVFDDLYLYQRARAIGADEGLLSAEALRGLTSYLGWTVRARIKFEDSFFTPQCTWEDVDRMVEAVNAALSGRQVRWQDLLEEWLTRLARHHGRRRWGYKTPQDFMHLDTLAKTFPGVRFVFIMRDPRAMMASMKYVRAEDGDPRQYHPVAYALYWKMAHRAMARFLERGGAPMEVVRFEELVADPDAVAARLGAFLKADVTGPVPVRGKNTSFGSGPRKTITETERWICERLAGETMSHAGYPPEGARPRLRDLGDLLRTTARFSVYQSGRLLTRGDARGSVAAFLRTLLRSRKGKRE